ncbi:MAG: hypothetical protein QM679_01090 [Patulibacter sp.]
MADDEQPTQILSRTPGPPGSGATTLDPHEPRLGDGGPGAGGPPKRPTGYGGNGDGSQWGDDGDGDGPDRRVAILGAIVGVLVVMVLFLLLKPGDDPSSPATTAATPTATATTTEAATPSATADQATATATTTPTPTATPTATSPSGGASIDDGTSGTVPLLTAGSITKFTASQGDTVTFQVRNDADTTQEVHVHGYDKAFDVRAGATKTISFQATITGIFEIEFEATGTQIGELTVEP